MVLDYYVILSLFGSGLSMIAIPDFRDKVLSFLGGIAMGGAIALIMEASPFDLWLRYLVVFIASICTLPILTYLHNPEEFYEAMKYFRAGLSGNSLD